MILNLQEHTAQGVSVRSLDDKEIEDLARAGNPLAMKEVAKRDMALTATSNDKLNIIINYLGLD